MENLRKIIKEILSEEHLQEEQSEYRKFRASIYYDVLIPRTENLEEDRLEAERIVNEDRRKMDNAETYVGGVAYYPSGKLPDQNEIDRL